MTDEFSSTSNIPSLDELENELAKVNPDALPKISAKILHLYFLYLNSELEIANSMLDVMENDEKSKIFLETFAKRIVGSLVKNKDEILKIRGLIAKGEKNE